MLIDDSDACKWYINSIHTMHWKWYNVYEYRKMIFYDNDNWMYDTIWWWQYDDDTIMTTEYKEEYKGSVVIIIAHAIHNMHVQKIGIKMEIPFGIEVERFEKPLQPLQE